MHITAPIVFKRLIRKLIFYPIIVAYRSSNSRAIIDEDIVRWCGEQKIDHISYEDALTKLMFNSTFRTVLYHRLPNLPSLIKSIFKADRTFFISPSCEIDGGLFFWHPLSTYLYARHIGKNCTIRQLTTFGNLGRKNPAARPYIGDNVDIGVNVTIIGDVKVGNNVCIGAGAVITKDIPDNCNVVGNPAYIVRRNGVKCHEKL